jgi:hypothetical protein
MKVFSVILAILAFVAIPAAAQTEHKQIPQDQVTAKSVQFIGDWNAVVCDPRESKPYGVRFNIRLDGVDTEDNGTETLPVFRLEAVQGHDIGEPFDFTTTLFTEINAEPGKHFLVLDTTNNSLDLILTLSDKTGRTVYEEDKADGLGGVVTTDSTGFEVEIIAEHGDDAKDLFGYVDSLAKTACPAVEEKPAPKTAPKNAVAQVASR